MPSHSCHAPDIGRVVELRPGMPTLGFACPHLLMNLLLFCTCGRSLVLSAALLPGCRAASRSPDLAWQLVSHLPRTGTRLLLIAAASPSSIACRSNAPCPATLLPRVFDSGTSQGCVDAGMLLSPAALRAGWLGDGHQVGGVHPAEPWQAVGGVRFQQQAVQGDLRMHRH